MANTILFKFSMGKDPQKQGTYGPGVCWRCGGKGEVECYDGTSTPCGACLGVVAPEPCPKCGANEAKIMSEGGSGCCWYCRACGHQGPWNRDDLVALKQWNKEASAPIGGKEAR